MGDHDGINDGINDKRALGPWRVVECSGLHDFMIVDADGTAIAELCGDRAVAEANAAFIVGAPEMSAVVRLVAVLDQFPGIPVAPAIIAYAKALRARIEGLKEARTDVA